MGKIRAGTLNRVVYLLRRGPDVDDGMGREPGAWLLLGKRFASVKPVYRGEVRDSDGQSARREISLWLWFEAAAAGMTARDAVAIDGVVHQLTGEPVEIGFREGIELRALAGDPVERVTIAELAAAA